MTQIEFLLALLFGAGALAGLAANRLPAEKRFWAPLAASLAPAAAFVWAALLPIGFKESRLFAPSLGIEFSWHVDGLAKAFALLILGIGALILVYTAGLMGSDPKMGRLVSGLMAFMASMVGLVLSDSLLLAFVFWELTSITSFLLIGFKSESEASRKAALQALIVTGSGGLAMLLGFLWLMSATGATTFSSLPQPWRGGAEAAPILLLIAAGVMTKSAQFPFHTWLPKAMEAPTPVSAYLHSATMVKAGVYLAARLQPAFAELSLWRDLLTIAALITMIFAIIMGWQARDFKRLLAATTIGSLAILIFLAVRGTKEAALAFSLFLIAHALYKAALFMTAGVIEKKAETRDPLEASGLGRKYPWVWAGAGLAGLSMAGLPPFFGFVAKEYTFGAGVSALVFLVLSLGVFASLQVAWRPFATPLKGQEPKPHSYGPAWAFTAPIMILGFLGLITGVLLDPFSYWLIKPAAQSLAPLAAIKTPHLWGGFTAELAFSVAALLLGGGLFIAWGKAPPKFKTERDWFAQGVALFTKSAEALARILDHRRIRFDFMEFLLVPCLLGLYLLLNRTHGLASFEFMPLQVHEVIVLFTGVIGAAMTMYSWSRLNSLALLGSLGFASTAIYLFMGAPDLALTQILVDLLTVVLSVLVLGRLPRFKRISRLSDRLRDAVIATVVGLFFGLATLFVLTAGHPPSVSLFHAANSVSGAKGGNVVNTIIVDFRALDTMGEITVLALAAWGIKELMRPRRKPS